ncbi:MAG: NAD-dependent epimerase/dehydratase family protein [Candidatus Binatia bacterium]
MRTERAIATSRALVTGASGLLGGCLVERLRTRGVRMRLLDMVPPADDRAHDAEVVRADLRDPAAVAEACRDVEIVYHLAAGQRMKPQFSGMSEQEIFDMNLTAVRHVLGGARAAGVRKVVHISSSGVYGIPRTIPVAEDHPQRPLGAYGRSKIAAETLCAEAVAAGLDVTVLRPMSLFGPGMTGVFLLLFEWVRLDKNVYLLGAGRNRVQMVSAWDVADACVLAAERAESRGAVLNLGAAEVPTVRAEVEALIARAGSRSRVVAMPAALVRNAARVLDVVGLSPIVPEHYLLADATFVLDVSAAERALGWRPVYSNVRMMAEAYDWYCRNWATVRGEPGVVLRLLNALS